MPRVTIDDREIEVEEGTTILTAAARLGIAIPTLCFLEGYIPSTSCQVCLVKDRQRNQWIPSCAAKVVDGMQIDSNTPEVREVRRTALELLFSDHVGDCLAPCFFACPAHMDIPLMLKQIGEEEVRQAIETVKLEIALPAILGRVCSKPCEKGCRRNSGDEPVAVCDLKRFVADIDLASEDPYAPDCKQDSGKHVAVIGAGSTGLAAAYYLRQEGHRCVLFEREAKAGGRLRTETSEEELPRDVLDAEVEQVLRLGVELRTGEPIEELEPLLESFDAVLLACGDGVGPLAAGCGLSTSPRGVDVEKETLQTARPNLFAAGSAIRRQSLYVRSVADGKLAARAIHQFISGQSITPIARPFSSRIGSLQPEETTHLASLVGQAPRATPHVGEEFNLPQAAEQADRCYACGCVSHGACRLERYAIEYEADPTRFVGERKPIEVIQRPGGIRFEPQKCIKCELCVQIANRAGEELGLSFVGRGFDVELAVPFGHSFEEGLARSAKECVAACPTGALAFAARGERFETQRHREHRTN